MKKILIINCSNRKMNTYKLLTSIEKLLINAGFETEIINLRDYKINFCNGCMVCVLKGDCFIRDDVKLIMNKIVSCDGLVVGTPVYLNNMSGALKSFIDRTCKWFHRTEVAQKPTIIVATTQGSGLKNTMNSIQESFCQWGVALCSKIGRTGRNINEPIELKEIEKFVTLVNNNGKGYCPSFKEVATYNVQKALGKKLFPLDNEYWKKNGWTNYTYFKEAKINILKKFCGNIVFKTLCKNIKPKL